MQRIPTLSSIAVLVLATACSKVGASGDGNRGTVTRRLAAGTAVRLQAAQEISSRTAKVGDPIRAVTVTPLLDERGDTVLPVGAMFVGSIEEIAPAENPREQGRLRVAFGSVQFGGESQPVHVRVNSLATTMRGRGVTGGEAAKVGVGAVAGGIAGRVIGGNRTGTIIGATAGAAAGGVYAAETRDVDIVLPAGGVIRVVLTRPFEREVARQR